MTFQAAQTHFMRSVLGCHFQMMKPEKVILSFVNATLKNKIDFVEKTTVSATDKDFLWDDRENENTRKRPRRDDSGVDSGCSVTNVEKYAAHPSYEEYEGTFYHISEFYHFKAGRCTDRHVLGLEGGSPALEMTFMKKSKKPYHSSKGDGRIS